MSTLAPATTIPKVGAPIITPNSGSYEADTLTITIESVPGSTVYYTTDETEPTPSSTEYTGPFIIDHSSVIKAIATKPGYANSNVTTSWFDLYWWQALGNGFNIFVNALAIDSSGNLIAGGKFTATSDGGTTLNYLAKWDGNNWSSLGGGTNGIVNALAFDSSGNLYVGGQFNSPSSYIAKWDGSSWSSVGGGTDSGVLVLKSDSGNLYAGGYFTIAGQVTVNNIAKWNGFSWQALGSGVTNNDTVRALTFDSNGNLYIGGEFTKVSGITANKVAKWTGSTWEALGAGISGLLSSSVTALVIGNNNNLYAGGYFSSPTYALAKWDGNSWSSLGAGIFDSNAIVYTLAFDNSGNLYVAGNFDFAGGLTVNNIAKWNSNTNTWSALGTGLNDEAYALAIDSSGNIYVGGYFTEAGGKTVNRVAKWGKKI